MQTKDYSITLDMLRTLPFRPFEIVEGDTGNVLHVTLLNNGDVMDLANCKLCIIFASSSGFSMQDETSGIVKTEGSGTFDVTLLPTAYGAGNVSADVQVYSGDDDATLITSTRFDFRCRKSLVSDDIIHASSAYPPLVEAARIANEAAATALAAAERIEVGIGILNVQPDWEETDGTSDAYIRNKPTIPSTPEEVNAAGKTSVFSAKFYAANWGADCLNLFDEVWALGAISTSTGADISSTTIIRSVNYISVSALSSYRLSADKSTSIRVFHYDASDTFLSSSVYAMSISGLTITTPESSAKIRIQISTTEITYFRWFMINAGTATKPWEPQDRGYHLKASTYTGLSGISAVTDIALSLPELINITEEQLDALQKAKVVPCYQLAGTEVVVVAEGSVPSVDIPIVVRVKGDVY